MSITSRTRLILLVGHPVSRSVSPQIFNRVFREEGIDACYLSLDIPPNGFARVFPSLLESGLSGNITVPFKEKALSFIDIPSEAAMTAGACNVFWVEEGMSHGDNTDMYGFLNGLSPRIRGSLSGMSAVILGAGGAARSIAVALLAEGLQRLLIANRSPSRGTDLAAFLRRAFPDREAVCCGYEAFSAGFEADYSLLVNAASTGWRKGEAPLIDPARIQGLRYYFDAIYWEKTSLMRACESIGVESVDGLEMLVQQGALALRRWFDIDPPIETMRECARRALEGVERR